MSANKSTGAGQDKSANGTQKNKKKRNWACIIYPDSAPPDWVDRLQKTGLEIAISPLHDKDVNPDNTPKKAHYHVILCYAGPTSFDVVKGITDSLNQPIPMALEQVKGYYRYLTHMDNPDKYQYDARDIRTLNGFDISDYAGLTLKEKNKILYDLQTLIRERDIREYARLLDYIQDNLSMDVFYVARTNTIHLNSYLKSRNYSGKSVNYFKEFGDFEKAEEETKDDD